MYLKKLGNKRKRHECNLNYSIRMRDPITAKRYTKSLKKELNIKDAIKDFQNKNDTINDVIN